MPYKRNNSVVSNVSETSTTVDYDISQITPYVFITAADTARQFPAIVYNRITCVINVANELSQIVYPPESGIESLKYPIRDNSTFPVSKYFDIVADRIAANVASNRRTLLYCYHGRSRSVSFVLAYLIKYHHLPLTTAFALVKKKRPVAHPNSNFWWQLMAYESYQQRLHYPQYSSKGYKNQIPNSSTYGQQRLNRISDESKGVFHQIPIVDMFTNSIQQMYQKPNRRFYRHHGRRQTINLLPSVPYATCSTHLSSISLLKMKLSFKFLDFPFFFFTNLTFRIKCRSFPIVHYLHLFPSMLFGALLILL